MTHVHSSATLLSVHLQEIFIRTLVLFETVFQIVFRLSIFIPLIYLCANKVHCFILTVLTHFTSTFTLSAFLDVCSNSVRGMLTVALTQMD